MVEKQIEINKDNARRGHAVLPLTYEGKSEDEILRIYEIDKPIYE